MPIVPTPDGRGLQVPDGTPSDEIDRVMRLKFGDYDQNAAFAAGRATGQGGSDSGAAADQFAQQGSFGLSNFVTAGARWAGQRLTGVKNPDTFATDMAWSHGLSQGEAEGHPYSATAGGVAGGLTIGGELGVGLKIIRGTATGGAILDAIAPKTGQKVLNVAKAALTNGAAGAGISVIQGNSTLQDLQSGAVSAVAGPMVGKVFDMAMSRAAPVAQRAMVTLSKYLDETPDVLERAFQSIQHLTGANPTLSELLGLKSQGMVKKLAAANPTIGEAANRAANMGGAPLADQLQAITDRAATRPQSAQGWDDLRGQATAAAMDQAHPVTGIKLRDTPVQDTTGVLNSPYITMALKPNETLRNRLNVPDTVLQRIQSGNATLGDLDQARRAVRDMQSQLVRPAPNSLHQKDPTTAKEFGDVANKIEGLGIKTDSRYGDVLDNYRKISQYTDGFTHALDGNSITDIPRDDPMMAAALGSVIGKQGYAHGNALYVAKAARDAIAPTTIQPQQGMGPEHITQGAMAATSGAVGFTYHAMRALSSIFGNAVPEKVQQQLASDLTNPARTQAAIARLRAARLSNDQIKTIAAGIGGSAGAHIAATLAGQNQQ